MRLSRPPLTTIIGSALRTARTSRAYSQAEVAERAGLAAEAYGRLERGGIVPRADTLVRLAVALGVTTDSLVGLAMGNEAVQAQSSAEAGDERPGLLKRREARRLLKRLDGASPRTLQLLDLLLAAVEKDAARPRAARPAATKRRR